ncbi:MAG: T9SS type A sorting domain-containing protein [Flavobacteriales bacterium]|nr:T9SS type A sorting domain-containing protein [Flavobacteriales bacterium]
MTRKIYLFLLVVLTIPAVSFGQNGMNNLRKVNINASSIPVRPSTSSAAGSNQPLGEKCQQKSRMEALMAADPLYRQGVEDARMETRRIMAELESGVRTAATVYTIPVVFHVIHKGESVGSGTNISDAQIQSAVDALNRDYRRTSADGGIAQGAGPDLEIQFCLAGVDPNGNPHSGINRVNGTSVSGYSSNGITSSNEQSVKNLSRWDNRYYLNVWVVSEIDGNGADISNPNNWGGGTAGYAYLPTNPVTQNSSLDGVVILNICTGNDPNQSHGYRLCNWAALTGRTLTHEVGHFLGLYHPFENTNTCNSETNCNTQGDYICDTPPTVQGSYCNSPACNNSLVENYMDYTEESCQNMFTYDQTDVVRATCAGVRNALTTTNNCGATSSNDYDAGISAISTPTGTICETTFSPVVTLNNYGTTTLTSVQIQYYIDSNGPSTYNWSGSLSSGSTTTVTLNSLTTSSGGHTFTAKTVSGTLNGSNTDQDTGNDQSSGSFTVSTGGSGVTLTLTLDCWGSETTWEIRNSSNTVVESGGPYTDNLPGGSGTITEAFCLAQGCYDFTIYDANSDGINGTLYPSSCNVDGDYTIVDGSNATLVQMTASNGNFGASATHNFCVGGGSNPTTTCGTLASYDGENFSVNSTDLPNFDFQAIDNDQQAVATNLANAGYTSNWMAGFYEVVAPGDTNWFVGSTSWHANTTVAADNWLTFGPVTMLDGDGQLSWKHMMGDNSYRDGYEVLVGTSGTAVADFSGATALFSVADNDASTDGDTVWTQQSVQLPSGTYAYQSLYFAFHHNALDQFLLFLDDIDVEGCTSLTVGVKEDEQFDFKVYPNPSNGNFTYRFKAASSQDITFTLVNSVGQTVWAEQSKGQMAGTNTISTDNLASGVYTLMVRSEKLNVSERLILTK